MHAASGLGCPATPRLSALPDTPNATLPPACTKQILVFISAQWRLWNLKKPWEKAGALCLLAASAG